MCGIYGLVDLRSAIDKSSLERQRDLLSHRGPDDSGLWISPSKTVGLAHRRLSIIDLSPLGHQPMATADGRCVIVFNGEIYNYLELKKELQAAGCAFRGNSDTEVILAAYRTWGDRFVSRLNGMFALVIHDAGENGGSPSLFMARDRVGKKPFYYRMTDSRFEFASELKALDLEIALDPVALNFYLGLGYIPGDLCIAKGVKKLLPAHAGRLDLRSFKLNVWRYWKLPQHAADEDADGEELADQVQALLEDAVRIRLLSDVPLGVLLSGGFDSSIISAIAARESSKPVRTFNIALPGSALDESGQARRIATFLGTEHHVLEAGQPSIDVIEEMAPMIDEPIADSSIIPSFLLSRLTRRHVTVALGGDGGDELFGGYLDYTTSLADEDRLHWVPQGLIRLAANMAAALPAGVRGRNRIASLRGGADQQLIWGSPYFDLKLRHRILGKDSFEVMGETPDAPERYLLGLFMEGRDPMDSMTRTHFGSILPDDFLVKVDRASMAHSLEVRAPFLDYRLVEFAFSSIPGSWKVSGGESRRIQRILARRLLPPDMVTNRKQGFSIPLDEWIRANDFTKVRELMPLLPPCIDRKEVEQLIAGEKMGRANGARLYALIMLALAVRNFTKRKR
jgi:asparagine synthase (glutamine-hydrolysing)